MLSILTNMGAIEASNALQNNELSLNQSIAQLSSGKRIVTAANDPAGLAISMEITGLLGALNQNSTNTANAQGMLQTADGALANIGNSLATMQQLATEAADGTINSTQRSALDSQYQALYKEINNIAQSSQFNSINLLQGASVTFQVGPTDSSANQLAVTMPDVTAAGLLGVTPLTPGTLLTSGTNVTVTAPGTDTMTLGTGATADSGIAANTVTSAAPVSGTLSSTPPNEVTLTVTGTTNSSGTGTVGTDSITFVLTDSNGTTSSPFTITPTNMTVQNLDNLGFDVKFNTGNTYAVGQQVGFVFGTSGNQVSIATQSAAQQQVTQTASGLSTLAGYRGNMGAYEQQLQTVSANLQSEQQNLTSALSNIQDANIAQTMASFTQYLVLQQADVSVLKNAQQVPQQLVALLQ